MLKQQLTTAYEFAAAGRTFAAAVAGAARREVPVAHLDVVGEADHVLDAAAGSAATVQRQLCLWPLAVQSHGTWHVLYHPQADR